MRFILLEDAQLNAEYGITPERIKEFKTADAQRRKALIHIILNNMVKKHPKILSLSNAFSKSCVDFGIDTDDNPFIELIPRLAAEARVDKKHDAHVCALIDMMLKGWVPKTTLGVSGRNKFQRYLLNPSLWYRNIDEFTYTVKIFETVLDASRLKRYFANTDNIHVKSLYNKQGQIKPAGSEADSKNRSTIFGTVEQWSGKDGSNDATAARERERAERAKARVTPQRGNVDKVAFLTDEDKARIRQECKAKRITYLSDVKDPFVGQQVFVYGKNMTTDSLKNGPSVHNPDAGYYVYTNKGNQGTGWQKVSEPGRETIYVPSN